jgi:release factor glutamine methyltransferase
VAGTWRGLLAEARERLGAARVDNAAQEARWLVQAAGGLDATALAAGLDGLAPRGAVERLDALVDRRLAGEPLQYVLGRWAFRGLELAVDPRVLIPRPETEVLAGLALDECERLGARVAVDLGTGSGALALALAVERPGLAVWGTDVSAEALEVAAANRGAVGGDATGVHLAAGPWWDALPADLAGRVDVAVANPPYVSEAEMDDLPPEVRAWEPRLALCAGPTGLEDVEAIVAAARAWLARPGTLLVEMAPHQVRRAAARAEAAGFASVSIWPDLAGRDRILLARA